MELLLAGGCTTKRTEMERSSFGCKLVDSIRCDLRLLIWAAGSDVPRPRPEFELRVEPQAESLPKSLQPEELLGPIFPSQSYSHPHTQLSRLLFLSPTARDSYAIPSSQSSVIRINGQTQDSHTAHNGS